MEIGKSIAKVRKAKGYSQAQIANYLETTQQQYSKYETGKQEIPARIIKKLSEFYNVTANKLIGIEKYMTEENKSNCFYRLIEEIDDMFIWAEDNKHITYDAMKLLQASLEEIKEQILEEMQ